MAKAAPAPVLPRAPFTCTGIEEDTDGDTTAGGLDVPDTAAVVFESVTVTELGATGDNVTVDVNAMGSVTVTVVPLVTVVLVVVEE